MSTYVGSEEHHRIHAAIRSACTDPALAWVHYLPACVSAITGALTTRLVTGDVVDVETVVTDILDDEAADAGERGELHHTPSPSEIDAVTEAITSRLNEKSPGRCANTAGA